MKSCAIFFHEYIYECARVFLMVQINFGQKISVTSLRIQFRYVVFFLSRSFNSVFVIRHQFSTLNRIDDFNFHNRIFIQL